jgi:hypothetical protein
MIVYTPLDLPKIEPDNWDTFWDIWNQHSGALVKVRSNGDHSDSPVGRNDVWHGLDIYSNPNIAIKPGWTAPFYDIKDHLPKLYNTLTTLPINNIQRVRLVSSKIQVDPHSDDVRDVWVARAYLHYTAPREQWFFTRPSDFYGERTYITRPSETNWFAYNDKYCWHATDYDANYPKILLQVFSSGLTRELVDRSINKYKKYTITYN